MILKLLLFTYICCAPSPYIYYVHSSLISSVFKERRANSDGKSRGEEGDHGQLTGERGASFQHPSNDRQGRGGEAGDGAVGEGQRVRLRVPGSRSFYLGI